MLKKRRKMESYKIDQLNPQKAKRRKGKSKNKEQGQKKQKTKVNMIDINLC